jgi:hypothetical protein
MTYNKEDFRGDPGVSYLVGTNLGALLFDVGFGPDSPTLSNMPPKNDVYALTRSSQLDRYDMM